MLECSGTRILFDPFIRITESSLSKPLPPLLEECGTASAIFITHPHLDHFANINLIQKYCSAPVYVADHGIETARGAGYETDRMTPLHAGESYHFGEISIEVYQSRHCVFDIGVIIDTLRHIKNKPLFQQGLAIERLNKHFTIGKDDIFAFEVKSSSQNIFILGSANTAEEINYPGGMDLLIFPYQGRHNMAAYSLPFLDQFRPKRVMLDHFDDAFPPISQRMDCEKFIRMAKEKHPDIDIFEPQENHWYEV